MSEDFGKWLLAARKKSGLTQEQLAKKAKISKPYIGTLENARPHTVTGAKPQPALEVVDALAKALGESVDDARLAAGYAPKTAVLPPELTGIDFSIFTKQQLEFIKGFLLYCAAQVAGDFQSKTEIEQTYGFNVEDISKKQPNQTPNIKPVITKTDDALHTYEVDKTKIIHAHESKRSKRRGSK